MRHCSHVYNSQNKAMQSRQQSLFRTTKEQGAKLREIDRKNEQAARIILEDHPGGLMEEWARAVLRIPKA